LRVEYIAGLLTALLLLGGFWAGWALSKDDGAPKAAIVDQLSLTHPNPDFVQEAAETLEEAGYRVDYYPGESVTVDFFRRLPALGYKVLIFREHSAVIENDAGEADGVSMFTSEAYSDDRLYAYESSFIQEGESERSALAESWYEGDSRRYFGITPKFITARTLGTFSDAIVIMMGCDGLSSDGTAQAFVEKGAATFIGWDNAVTPAHTDAAVQQLLQHLFAEQMAPEQATALTMDEVGADPSFGAHLRLFPLE
jgi:hypothetical protein